MRRGVSKTAWKLLTLALFALAFAPSALAVCTPQFVTVPGTAAIASYDPFAATDTNSNELRIDVRNAGTTTCDLALQYFTGTASSTGAATSGSSTLTFQLHAAANDNALLRSGSPPGNQTPGAQQTINNVASGATVNRRFVLRVPAGQIVPPGTYTALVTIALYERQGSDLLFDTRTLNISITVGAQMSVNIAGGSSLATTLAFGNLIANDVRSVDIQARSNQSFKFTATSDNGGVLKLDPNPGDGVNWQVPYTVKINNGSPLTLSSAQSVGISSTATTLGGMNVPVQVTLGNPAGQRAGIYKDVITVKIEASP